MTIKGVAIGDKFVKGNHTKCEVVDFYEVKSLTNSQTIYYICIAKVIESAICGSVFEVPFSTVIRFKIN